jgi:hypothetical protein
MVELPLEVHEMVHANPEVAYEHGLLVKSHDDPNQIQPKVREFLAALGYEGEIGVKPKRRKLDTQERRQRKRITVAVPNDTEDGGAVWDDMLALVKQKLVELGLYESDAKIPNYEALIACMYAWVTE